MKMTPAQLEEIRLSRAQSFSTRRPTVAALEEILFNAIPVLDHGFVRVVDYLGDDGAVVQAARVSYGKGTKKQQDDKGLVRYLMRNGHTTPFEMAEIKLHVKLPIFVARQWIRHRTANVNEYSARYSVLDREFYVPRREQLAAQSKSNRQGRGGVLDNEEADKVLHLLRTDAERAYEDYQWMLNEDADGYERDSKRKGLTRELARINLALSTYTQWYWKVDLHNLMNFLRLRADTHAQYEIRCYAHEILQVLNRWVPLTFDAFLEYRLNAVTLSRTAVEVIKRLIAGERVTAETSGLSNSEWHELGQRVGLESPKPKSS